MMRGALAVSSDLTLRRLTLSDLAAVDELNLLAVGPRIDPNVVKPESHAYFESIFAGRGFFVGVFDGPLLVAYAILQHDHAAKDDPRESLGLPPGAPVGRLAGARVAPAYRGRHLQRALIAARVAAAPPDMLLFSTAAPVNTPSWCNLLAEGFPIRDIQFFFGGYARYLMVRDGSSYDPAASIVVDPLDTERQKVLFAEGWRGYARGQLETGAPGVIFGKPALG
ncbi:hypothetical protein V5F59_12705 [Xanthobacter autotrophicus DSM 431]|uniref:hypothetical protein n=1 Tax=Xanthobacter nonsaccharivorans TaxID=3119912 RepID=UPI00372B7E8D